MNSRTLRRTALAVLLTGSLALAGCGADSGPDPTPQAEEVSASDFWVKATDEDMTAAFGVLVADEGNDLTLLAASTPAAGKVEIHEVVMVDGEMVMRPKDAGIPVPAGGQAALEPGGDHIMLMELTGPIAPGDVVALTLEFADGSTLDVSATAKQFSGGNEEYSSGDH